jgi:hypothetical protein
MTCCQDALESLAHWIASALLSIAAKMVSVKRHPLKPISNKKRVAMSSRATTATMNQFTTTITTIDRGTTTTSKFATTLEVEDNRRQKLSGESPVFSFSCASAVVALLAAGPAGDRKRSSVVIYTSKRMFTCSTSTSLSHHRLSNPA